jgi:hypothetical protein
MLQRLLEYKPGAASYIVGGVLLLVAMALFVQYKKTGRVNLAKMMDRGSDLQPFFDRNPHLELADSYPNTSFVVVRDPATGKTAMLDLAPILTAEVRPTTCEDTRSFSPALIYTAATGSTCFTIHKPDTGAGVLYTYGASFTANAKDSQVEQFYRDLFTKRGKKISVIQSSSEAIILEAEDEKEDTVARISIRGSFDTSQGFLAWTDEFR